MFITHLINDILTQSDDLQRTADENPKPKQAGYTPAPEFSTSTSYSSMLPLHYAG